MGIQNPDGAFGSSCEQEFGASKAGTNLESAAPKVSCCNGGGPGGNGGGNRGGAVSGERPAGIYVGRAGSNTLDLNVIRNVSESGYNAHTECLSLPLKSGGVLNLRWTNIGNNPNGNTLYPIS